MDLNKFNEFNFIDKDTEILCEDGWEQLIYDFCKDISSNVTEDFKIWQIKEKIGGLRINTDNCDNVTFKKIQEAWQKSYSICEKCGKTGRLRRLDGILQTLCVSCLNEYEQNM